MMMARKLFNHIHEIVRIHLSKNTGDVLLLFMGLGFFDFFPKDGRGGIVLMLMFRVMVVFMPLLLLLLLMWMFIGSVVIVMMMMVVGLENAKLHGVQCCRFFLPMMLMCVKILSCPCFVLWAVLWRPETNRGIDDRKQVKAEE